jgi:2-oxoglutarate ferredoxin oxidoreductase subunit delta
MERIMIKVTINQEYCKGCYYCIQLCHKGCLSMSNQLNSKGFPFPTLVNPEECTGCGACALLCPDFAIEVILD